MIKVDWARGPVAGSFGAVYRGLDDEDRRTVAVKVLMSDDAESIAAFADEYRIMRHLQGLACVPQVRGLSMIRAPAHPEIDGRRGLFMEWLHGQTLKQLIARGRPLAANEAIRLARAVLRAVGSLHGHDILHRDLHPGNLHLSRSGEVRILDYGEACSIWLARRGRKGLYLTNGYEPPEAVRGGEWSAASDVYMVARSLVHARYGEPLQRKELPDDAFGRWAGLCMQDDPALRPQTCREAAAHLPARLDRRKGFRQQCRSGSAARLPF